MGLVLLRAAPAVASGGSLTVLLSVNGALMTIIHDKYLDTGPCAADRRRAPGRDPVGDALMLAWLRPSPERLPQYATVAFAVPAVQYLCYLLAVMLWARVAWSVHLWTGADRDRGRRGLAPQLPRRGARRDIVRPGSPTSRRGASGVGRGARGQHAARPC